MTTLFGASRAVDPARWFLPLAFLGLGCHEGALIDPRVERIGGGASGGGVELHRAEGKPALLTVRREGDPQPAMTVLVRAGDDPRTTALLALVTEARLTAKGIHAERRIDRDAFELTVYLGAVTPEAFTRAIDESLRDPIGDADVLAATRGLAEFSVKLEPPHLRAVRRCEAAFGWEASPAPPTRGELEAARALADRAPSIAFGIVGPDDTCAAGAKAVLAVGALPSEGGILPSAPAAPSASSAEFAVGRGEVGEDGEIEVALAVSDARAAVEAVHRLNAPSPLAAKLALLPAPYRLEHISAVARARGGCLSVTLRSLGSGPDSSAEAVAIARAELAEASALLAGALPTRSFLTGSARKTAEVAARWAATEAAAAGPGAAVAVTLASTASESDLESTKTRVAAASAARAEISTRGRVEKGQTDLWVLLADPCAAAEEPASHWGAAAVIAGARALDTDDAEGVRVEPWITSAGVGIIAHGAALEKETPDQLAQRVAEAASKALVGAPPSTDSLARSAAEIRASLERDWGRQTLGLDRLADAAAPGAPSLLEPRGSFATVTGLDVGRAAGAAQALARDPLRLSVIANASASQTEAARAEVERWVLPGPRRACGAAPTSRPGASEIPGARAGSTGRAWIAIPVAGGGGEKSRATLQETRGDVAVAGALVESFAAASPTHAGIAVRTVRSSPFLLIDVRAEPDQLDAATRDAVDFVAEMGRGATADDALGRAIAAAKRAEREEVDDPRERLATLLLGETDFGAAPDIDAAGFRRWAAATLAPERFVVTKVRP